MSTSTNSTNSTTPTSSATTSTVPGMLYPTQKGMISGNPRDSAMQQMTDTNIKQTTLSNAVGGKRRSRRSRKGGSGIAIPQFQMQYTPQGGPGTTPNSQIQQNLQTSTQGSANSVYDSDATKMGGSRKRKYKRGGNPNWQWGCYSGGAKNKKSRKNKKTRKNKKSRKYNKH
jgi:hypothetical protein